MMRMSSLTGLPVVLGGKVQGHVEQPVLTPDGKRLRGLTIRQGLRGARWIDRSDVMVLGGVSVVIGSKPGRMPPDADFTLSSVTDSTGLRLGLVTDVYLDPLSLRVAALEITLGLVEALTCGPLLCREYRLLRQHNGENRIIIPSGTALLHASSLTEKGGSST